MFKMIWTSTLDAQTGKQKKHELHRQLKKEA